MAGNLINDERIYSENPVWVRIIVTDTPPVFDPDKPVSDENPLPGEYVVDPSIDP